MNVKKYASLYTLVAALALSGCASLKQRDVERFRDDPLVEAMLAWAPKDEVTRRQYAQSIDALAQSKVSDTEKELLQERYNVRTKNYTLNTKEQYILKKYGRNPQKATAGDLILLHRLAEVAAFGNVIDRFKYKIVQKNR